MAYLGHFEVVVYNIQKPSKEKILADYTLEYFNKLIIARKLALKKKNEKTLA